MLQKDDLGTLLVKQPTPPHITHLNGTLWLNTQTQKLVHIEEIKIGDKVDEKELSKAREFITKSYKEYEKCEEDISPRYLGIFEKEGILYIASEFNASGSVLGLLDAGPMEEGYIAIVLREVLKGLASLHNAGKYYGDVKAEEILIGKRGEVKLQNFGLSNPLAILHYTIYKRTKGILCPFWSSPESITKMTMNAQSDIWSLGITAIEMAHGKVPLHDVNSIRATFTICKNPPPELHGNFSEDFTDFVSQCLQKEPHERMTANQLLKHKFIKNAKRVGLLRNVIAKRIKLS